MPVRYLSLGSAVRRVAISVSAKMLTSYVLSIFVVLFILGVVTNDAQAGDYQLGAGDVVKVFVYGNEDLTTEDRITESGNISFPFLGEITIGGLTKGETESRITGLLNSGGIINNPQVNVRILKFREPMVSVLGQVNRPGRYPVEPFKTLLDALADAGGLSPLAEDQVVVLRREGEKTVQFKLDLRATFDDGNLENILSIKSGDIISVPKADQFYVYGAVQRSGVFRLERDMTVIQALSVAGGLSARGTDRGLVVRRLDTTHNTVVELSVTVADMLKANDVLVIKESLF